MLKYNDCPGPALRTSQHLNVLPHLTFFDNPGLKETPTFYMVNISQKYNEILLNVITLLRSGNLTLFLFILGESMLHYIHVSTKIITHTDT